MLVVQLVRAARFMSGVGRVLIRIAIPLCGWVEDVAARKKPKLFPRLVVRHPCTGRAPESRPARAATMGP
ncbi:hypothetical protein OHB41_27025 [Streptomyces sp. NBC_01571]|uniref:hypothetical protein n=1 Tax=Streptomyces sp. NBC_01571 TaxID=2975883 RepID=UPI0022583687|nr:hypothetical protein [Streptomyces sp. NBC_01571]MCX4576758.1 hypothetical protein [Streptomyces sp. NBC_01571]